MSSGVKLLMPYLIVGLVAALVGIAGLAEKTAILEASTPTAVFISLITMKFGGDSRFANNAIVFSTLASFATLTVLLTNMI